MNTPRIIPATVLLSLLVLFGHSALGAEKADKTKKTDKTEKKKPVKKKTAEKKKDTEKKNASKDPLSKFKAEDRVQIKFCFDKFVEALGKGDAKVVKAFLAKVPKNLAALDLDKEGDRKTLLQAYASLKGATANSGQRMMGGLGQINYTNASGASKSIRMKMDSGTWKIAGE